VVLLKDKEWSARLSKYVGMLPSLQKGHSGAGPVQEGNAGQQLGPERLRRSVVSGQANTGAKTIGDQSAERRSRAA